MRLLTPDLHQFAKRYVKRDKMLVKMYKEAIPLLGIPLLKTGKVAEVFDAGMRLGGHTFLYDGEILTDILKGKGFERERCASMRAKRMNCEAWTSDLPRRESAFITTATSKQGLREVGVQLIWLSLCNYLKNLDGNN